MASKAPQLNVRMDPDKISLLKEIADVDGKSLNQLVDDELTAVIARRATGVAESVRRRADWVDQAAAAYAARLPRPEPESDPSPEG